MILVHKDDGSIGIFRPSTYQIKSIDIVGSKHEVMHMTIEMWKHPQQDGEYNKVSSKQKSQLRIPIKWMYFRNFALLEENVETFVRNGTPKQDNTRESMQGGFISLRSFRTRWSI